LILEYAGKDVGQIMGDEDQHVHSRSAYEMMEEYRIGELGGDEKIVSEGGCYGFALFDVCQLLQPRLSEFLVFSKRSVCDSPSIIGYSSAPMATSII